MGKPDLIAPLKERLAMKYKKKNDKDETITGWFISI